MYSSLAPETPVNLFIARLHTVEKNAVGSDFGANAPSAKSNRALFENKVRSSTPIPSFNAGDLETSAELEIKDQFYAEKFRFDLKPRALGDFVRNHRSLVDRNADDDRFNLISDQRLCVSTVSASLYKRPLFEKVSKSRENQEADQNCPSHGFEARSEAAVSALICDHGPLILSSLQQTDTKTQASPEMSPEKLAHCPDLSTSLTMRSSEIAVGCRQQQNENRGISTELPLGEV